MTDTPQRVEARELGQDISAVLKRIAAGETVEVTEHGHAVARIVPLRHGSRYAQMVAEGRITPAVSPRRLLAKFVITYDARLGEAARQQGLNVVSPS